VNKKEEAVILLERHMANSSMSYPKTLTVLIEGDDTETKAIRLHVSSRYNAAEYEDGLGRRYYIDQRYMDECVFENKPPHIPLAVISKNEAMREKLEWGRQQLAAQKKREESKLILPDGFETKES
jgi:hypothetical protein